MALCERARDCLSRYLLLVQLRVAGEDHACWLEKQLRLIDQVGLSEYLRSHTGAVEGT